MSEKGDEPKVPYHEVGEKSEPAVAGLISLFRRTKKDDKFPGDMEEALSIIDEIESYWNDIRLMLAPYTEEDGRSKQIRPRRKDLKTLGTAVNNVSAEIASVRMILNRLRRS